MNSDFIEYFKKMRKKHKKTQEDIALSMKKTKMLISGIETGKNNPPIGKDLETMMNALELEKNERKEFEYKATIQRGTLPFSTIQYIKKNNKVLDVLDSMKQKNITNKDCDAVIGMIEKIEV